MSESIDYENVEQTLDEMRQLMLLLERKVKILEGIVTPPQHRGNNRVRCISSAPRPHALVLNDQWVEPIAK